MVTLWVAIIFSHHSIDENLLVSPATPIICALPQHITFLPNYARKYRFRILAPLPKNSENEVLGIFLSKPQAWHIITRSVYIIAVGVYHHQRCIFCGLMIYRNKLRMIYKAYALMIYRLAADDMQFLRN